MTASFDRAIRALDDHACEPKQTSPGHAQARCPCPGHGRRRGDIHPSLSVYPRPDGKGRWAGCTRQAVLDEIELHPRDLYDDPGMRDAYKRNTDYIYPNGDRKRRRTRPDGTKDVKWGKGANGGKDLYLVDKIPADRPLTAYLTEGEKAARAIRAMGAVAVSTGGAARTELDYSPLRGVDVIPIVDRDKPGLEWAAKVGKQLDGVAASVRFVRAAVDIPRADVVEHFDAELTLAQLEEFDPFTTVYDAEPVAGNGNGIPLEEPEPVDGAELLDDLVTWWARFIAVTDPDDLNLLALWAVHTHLVNELYTSPRLLIDSIMEGSGKSTVIDHLNRLCLHPVQAATISSPALIPRLLEYGMRTILLDEAHRALRPDRPGVDDLLGIINTGYRHGATRPVLVPTKGGGWDADEMPTYAPLAMAGNHPNLPADTTSRQIGILLMPDLDGAVEDSDWERIEGEAAALKARIAAFADWVRGDIKGMDVDLPAGCIGRCKEKWRPLARVAAAAGGDWPETARRLIDADMALEAAEREAGLRKLPPGMVVMHDLWVIWPKGESFVPTRELVTKLIGHHPDYWGAESPYGKPLTETRLGLLIDQATKLTSCRPGGRGPRGYPRATLAPVWHRLGIGRRQPGAPGEPGEPGAEQPHITGLTDLTECTGLEGAPTEPGGFVPPTGPGRCEQCGWHVEKQGHSPDCPAKDDEAQF
jgi:hypothetical protein